MELYHSHKSTKQSSYQSFDSISIQLPLHSTCTNNYSTEPSLNLPTTTTSLYMYQQLFYWTFSQSPHNYHFTLHVPTITLLNLLSISPQLPLHSTRTNNYSTEPSLDLRTTTTSLYTYQQLFYWTFSRSPYNYHFTLDVPTIILLTEPSLDLPTVTTSLYLNKSHTHNS